MAYKSVFSIITAPAQAHATIIACADLCADQGAHLDVLAIGIDRLQMGYSYMGSEAVLLDATMAQATEEARLNEAAARAALAEPAPGLHWALESAVVQFGMVNDLVANHARFADLVVLGRPYDTAAATGADTVLEAALFQARTPVLVVPTDHTKTVIPPRRIVLAWDQSPEALTTIVDPKAQGSERSDPGGLLCQMLVRHGVKAEVSVLAKTLPRVSDVLARQVMDMNADMLVMGAYGHSRLREAIMGGATRDTLHTSVVPVFMAH
jgi:nucleotide-binding universal stress UspA family protein